MKRDIPKDVLAQIIQIADTIDQQDATWRASADVPTPQPQLFPYQAQQLRDLVDAYRWNRRVVELVSAEDSIIRRAYTKGHIVVVDGRTGRDACETTAEACFDSLFDEANGGDSPYRLDITVGEQGIDLTVSGGPRVEP